MSDNPAPTLVERLRGPISRPTVPMDLGNGQTIQVRGLLYGYEDDQLRAEAALIIETQTAEIALLKRGIESKTMSTDDLPYAAMQHVHRVRDLLNRRGKSGEVYERIVCELLTEAVPALCANAELLERALRIAQEQRAFIQSQYDKLNEWQTRHASEVASK